MKVIADLTKCFPNTHEDAISRVLQFCREQNILQDDLKFFARPDQALTNTELQRGLNWQTVPGDRVQVALAVKAALSRVDALSQNGQIWLLSYDANILRLAAEPGNQARVSPIPLGTIRFAGGGFNRPPLTARRARPWIFEQVIPLQDALDALVRVLRNRRSYSVENHFKSTELRPAMAALNPRFVGNGLQTGTAGMMSALIAIAEERGIISVDRTTLAHNALIWLKESPNPATEALTATSPTTVTAAFTPPPPQPLAIESLTEMSSAAAATPVRTPPSPQPSPEAADGADSPHRSRRLEVFLREKNMGPYTVARLAMYDAIEAVIGAAGANGGKFPTLDSLIDAAKDKASEVLKSVGQDTTEKKQPWSKIKSFLQRLLTQAAAMLDENGQPISAGWSSRLRTVKSVADNWRTKADAEIVLSLITDADDISEDDVSALARILYHKDDLESRAATLRAVAHLIETGKAVEATDGSKRVLRPSGHKGRSEASPD